MPDLFYMKLSEFADRLGMSTSEVMDRMKQSGMIDEHGNLSAGKALGARKLTTTYEEIIVHNPDALYQALRFWADLQ